MARLFAEATDQRLRRQYAAELRRCNDDLLVTLIGNVASDDVAIGVPVGPYTAFSPGVSFAFGLSFSWPALNYGQIANNVRVQEAKLQASRLYCRNNVLEAKREVEGDRGSLVQSRLRLGSRDFANVPAGQYKSWILPLVVKLSLSPSTIATVQLAPRG